ncbi:hypothetical protein PMI42_04864 [Bradyrhizobium sp. YR681]|uniref:hypothetical protein n=1 Tax=Bradyrhizobium sp. YR681 TaxID=1144344 RepID=UPI000271148D|nr:hypothetical protein [Bradyrhizobium sp. YR681]EJN11849.1 hypothetical protein PMI42_04864 [Bradyrhizobium sp. YR681]
MTQQNINTGLFPEQLRRVAQDNFVDLYAQLNSVYALSLQPRNLNAGMSSDQLRAAAQANFSEIYAALQARGVNGSQQHLNAGLAVDRLRSFAQLNFTDLYTLLAGASAAVRVVADTTNSFYVMARSLRGTAFAYHFIRNSGGNTATDLGGSWPNWRYAGCAEFLSVSLAPTGTPLRTFSNDTGAQDYAFVLPTSSVKFAGSYHGVGAGGSLTAETLTIDGQAFDPTSSAAVGSQVILTHSVSITDGSSTVTVTGFTVTIDASGIVFNPGTISSSAVLSTAFVGMAIATGSFDEGTLTLTSGTTEYKTPISTGTTTYGRTYMQKANMVSLRKTSDGLTVRVSHGGTALAGYRRTSVVRDTVLNRAKLYFDFGNSGGAFGSLSGFTWSQSYELGAAGATSFAANLITNGAFAANINNWTTTSGSVAWNAAGVMRHSRSATGTDDRSLQAITTVVGAPYLLAAENTYTPVGPGNAGTYVNPGSIALGSASNGSLITPAPAYAKVAFDQNGYNAHVVIPTQTTQYPMLILEAQGAANTLVGDTSDFDNVSMFALAA